jgi:hypothetical protein
MTGPLAVMTVLLTETAAGAAVMLWVTGIWGHVRRGFLLLTGITAALSAWGGWATARAGVDAARLEGRSEAVAGSDAMIAGLLVFAALLTLWQVVLMAGRERAARVVGFAATAAGPVALALVAASRGDQVGLAVAEVMLGALFLGSTLYGLLLGHWYLFERRLSNDHMIRGAKWYVAGVVAAALAAALSALNPPPQIGGFSPFLAVPGFSLYLAAGLVAVCALIAAFVWRLAHEGGRSIQAATGLFYLAVIMAFSAEMAAKFRFFG